MSLWEYRWFWIAMGLVFVVVHAALTGPPGSLMAKAITLVARYLGWTKD